MAKSKQTGFSFGDFDFTKMFSDMKVPGFDMEALLANQKKNLDALNEAGKLAMSGAQSLATRQGEMFKQNLEQFQQIATDLASVKDPQEFGTKQAAVAQKLFEQAVANMKEMSESVSEASSESFAVISKRAQENLDALAKVVPKA